MTPLGYNISMTAFSVKAKVGVHYKSKERINDTTW